MTNGISAPDIPAAPIKCCDRDCNRRSYAPPCCGGVVEGLPALAATLGCAERRRVSHEPAGLSEGRGSGDSGHRSIEGRLGRQARGGVEGIGDPVPGGRRVREPRKGGGREGDVGHELGARGAAAGETRGEEREVLGAGIGAERRVEQRADEAGVLQGGEGRGGVEQVFRYLRPSGAGAELGDEGRQGDAVGVLAQDSAVHRRSLRRRAFAGRAEPAIGEGGGPPGRARPPRRRCRAPPAARRRAAWPRRSPLRPTAWSSLPAGRRG